MQKRTQTCLRILSTKCVYKSYIYLIYMYKQDLALNNLLWLIGQEIKPNGILWHSLTICPYHPSLLAGPMSGIQCPHRDDVSKYLQVSQHWCICVCVCGGDYPKTLLEFIPGFLTLPSMSCLSYSDGLWDRVLVAIQLFHEFCFQDLFKNILVCFPFSYFSMWFVKFQMVQSYNSTDMVTAWILLRYHHMLKISQL